MLKNTKLIIDQQLIFSFWTLHTSLKFSSEHSTYINLRGASDPLHKLAQRDHGIQMLNGSIISLFEI